ncbi:hypothetical protein [Streptomyces griseus]|uniref:hypothetical protein n=1 Tax=Streptomyces griseus TaxID=1911 RepID=UPI00378A6714
MRTLSMTAPRARNRLGAVLQAVVDDIGGGSTTTTALLLPPVSETGNCTTCKLPFEACRCGTVLPTATHGGILDDIGREDDRGGHDGRGYERDETDRAFRDLVEHLVADGDDRAAVAGRRARRTLQEMDPGYERQPVLILHRPTMEQCPLCMRFNCGGHDCPPGVTTTKPECKGDLSKKQDRKDLSKKVGEANKRSEKRPK